VTPVLLDTTAWIDFLRPGTRVLGDTVRRLIEADRARICGAVVAELLRGVKGPGEQAQLSRLLGRIKRLETREDDWDAAGIKLKQLRESGITVPLADALIAVVARRNGVPVLTADLHFRHLDLDLYTLDDPGV